MNQTQLSDNQRRTLCRIGFILLCVLPTLAVGYWIFHPQTSGQWSQAIKAQLAVETKVASVETPGPYVTILREVEFSDRDGKTLFDATQVRVIRGATNEIRVETPVQLSSHALMQLVTNINEHVIRSHAANRPWKILLGKTIILGDSPDAVTPRSVVANQIAIDVLPQSDGTVAKMFLRLADTNSDNWVRGYIRSWTGNAPVKQRIGLDTGSDSVPTWLLADLVPDLDRLGRDCQFNGVLQGEKTVDESKAVQFTGELAGVFTGIDLAQLVAPYDHKLAGYCDANVVSCRIRNGRIHELNSNIRCPRGGSIGLPLLVSIANNLRLEMGVNLEQPVVKFSNLNLNCLLKDGQLFELHSSGGNGTLATDANGTPLLVCMDDQPKRFENLVDSLVNTYGDNPNLHDEKIAWLRRFHLPLRMASNSGADGIAPNRY